MAKRKLKIYAKKRKCRKTSEPPGSAHKISKQRRIYVVQKHQARRLHYDLRLEINGVLKSWALPKGIPKTVEAGKRLAVQTENHPLEYASFSGTIPEGYGAGTVEIWDKGTFELIEKTANKIIFKIKGRKIKGTYILLKAVFGDFAKSGKNWLIFRKKE